MIAYYSRVSTAEQAENGYSIDEQQERLEKYCDAMGWSARQSYTDPGFSGASTNRPALQKLIKDVKAGKIQKVLVYKLDRLSRSQKDTLYLIEDVFIANGCDFVSMSENFDTSTPLGRAMIGILAVFAQLEREQIKERMMMGKQARVKSFKCSGSSRPPIGYDYDHEKGDLVVNEFEKMQIVNIFEWFAAGMSIPKITNRLNAAGMRQKYGTWCEQTVRRALSRKTYLGLNYSNGEWYQGNHDPIIDKELFDHVQAIVERTHLESLAHNRRCGKANSILGGYLYCAQCGNRYAHKCNVKSYGTYDYYACNSRYRKKTLGKGRVCQNKTWYRENLEEIVFDEIRKLTLESYIPPKRVDDRPGIIENRLSDVDKQIERLIDLYASGTLPTDKLQAKIDALNEERSNLENELELIEEEKKERLSYQDAVQMVSTFDEILENGSFDEIRAVIGALIEKIEINNDDITIYWAFS